MRDWAVAVAAYADVGALWSDRSQLMVHTRFEQTRRVMRWILALLYGLAGVAHIRTPEAFRPIVPDWVPWPHHVVIFTGLCEIAGAIALLVPRLRSTAAIMLAIYAVAVFPANLKHAFEQVEVAGLPSSWWYHGPRLLLQPVLVWWALFCGGVIGWPVGREHRANVAADRK